MTECDSRFGCIGLTRGAPVLQRLQRIEHRRQRLVLDVDELRGFARRVPIDRSHGRQHIPDTPNLLPLGDKAGPVLVDAGRTTARQARQPPSPRRRRPERALRARRVDANHARARVRRQHQRRRAAGPAGPGRPTNGRSPRASLTAWYRASGRPTRPSPTGSGIGSPRLAARHQRDRVDDLHVARAPAQVHVDRAGNLVTGRIRGCGRADTWPGARSPGCRSRTVRRQQRQTPSQTGRDRRLTTLRA